jgi:plasmid stabilization system protein ParE
VLRLSITKAAKNNLQEAVRYYNRQQSGLGKRFRKEVEDSFERIKAMPQSASILYDTVRYKMVEGFPFIVVYEFDEVEVIILSVFNTHKNPDEINP